MPADVPTTGPNLRSKDERPPVEPLAALRHTQAGANAFAKFFIRTIDWAYATMSTAYMRYYFADSCDDCRSAGDAIDRDRRAGNRVVGDRFTVRRVRAGRVFAHGLTAVVTFDINSSQVINKRDGFVIGDGATKNYRERVYLQWRHSAWEVTEMVPTS